MNADIFFRNYYRPLCIYALHYLHDAELVEDIVQDSFMHLLETGDEPLNTHAWLYTAVRNRCIDLLRRKGRQGEPLLSSDGMVMNGFVVDEEVQERSLREAQLWEAVDALPDRQREVLLLAKRDGFTYREIALRLGISEKTVEHQLSRAMKKLRSLT